MSDERHRRWGTEQGSVTVLTAAVLFLACSLTLVSVDLLGTLAAKARAQAAADAAALAAARELALPSAETPTEAAADFAARNGATLVSCSCEPGTMEAIVEVSVPVDLRFVGGDRTVHALARAVVGTG